MPGMQLGVEAGSKAGSYGNFKVGHAVGGNNWKQSFELFVWDAIGDGVSPPMWAVGLWSGLWAVVLVMRSWMGFPPPCGWIRKKPSTTKYVTK